MGPTPPEGALQGLETLRSQTVDAGRRALSEAERAYRAAELAHEAAMRARAVQERALRAARAGFATAGSVFALRLAEAAVGSARTRLTQADLRVVRTLQQVQRAAGVRAARQLELRAAELGRRAVARTLEQRAAAVSLRTERGLESEAEDNFRAAAGARAPQVSSIR